LKERKKDGRTLKNRKGRPFSAPKKETGELGEGKNASQRSKSSEDENNIRPPKRKAMKNTQRG